MVSKFKLHLVLIASCAAAVVAAGCASPGIPPELSGVRQQYEIAAANAAVRDDAPIALLEAKRAVEKAEAGFASKLPREEVSHRISLASARIEVATAAARANAAQRSVDQLRKQRDREGVTPAPAPKAPEPEYGSQLDAVRSLLDQMVESVRASVAPVVIPVAAQPVVAAPVAPAPAIAPAVSAPAVDYRAQLAAEAELARLRAESARRAEVMRAEESATRGRIDELQRASASAEREIEDLRRAAEAERERTARLLAERHAASGSPAATRDVWQTNESASDKNPLVNEGDVR